MAITIKAVESFPTESICWLNRATGAIQISNGDLRAIGIDVVKYSEPSWWVKADHEDGSQAAAANEAVLRVQQDFWRD